MPYCRHTLSVMYKVGKLPRSTTIVKKVRFIQTGVWRLKKKKIKSTRQKKKKKKCLLFPFLIQVCQYEYFKGFHWGLGQQTIIRFKSVTAYWLRLIPYTTQDRVKEQWAQCKIISSPDMSCNALTISKRNAHTEQTAVCITRIIMVMTVTSESLRPRMQMSEFL